MLTGCFRGSGRNKVYALGNGNAAHHGNAPVKAVYVRRKETVERGLADAKQLHGHRYASMRGTHKVQEQSLLCARTANVKKTALALSKGGGFYSYLSLIFHNLPDIAALLRLGLPRTSQRI